MAVYNRDSLCAFPHAVMLVLLIDDCAAFISTGTWTSKEFPQCMLLYHRTMATLMSLW